MHLHINWISLLTMLIIFFCATSYPVVSEGYTIQDVPNILKNEYCDLQSLKMLFTCCLVFFLVKNPKLILIKLK